MTTLLTRTRNRFSRLATRFHSDERGVEALQMVVILAVAALVLLMLSAWVGTANDTLLTNTLGGWVKFQIDWLYLLDFTQSYPDP